MFRFTIFMHDYRKKKIFMEMAPLMELLFEKAYLPILINIPPNYQY